MGPQFFTSRQTFTLENGSSLPLLEVAYHTYGTLNTKKDNVIWICHALTANSDVADWWSTLVGPGRRFDPAKHFIVCANIIGSCYGSSGPMTRAADTNTQWFGRFPMVTIRDMVKAHILLRRHLHIEQIQTLVGGSMGGYQAIEWVLTEPAVFKQLVLVATSPRESAWGISIHTAQRLAIEADPTFSAGRADAGAAGLKAARAIGMLTYRNYEAFVNTQTDADNEKLDDFKASSYISYQGDKLVKRFNAHSYWLLTKAMDSHNISRGRDVLESVLSTIDVPAAIIGISTDFLCPLSEQKFMAKHIPHAAYHEIDSPFGHDGFLIEGELIGKCIPEL